MNYANEDGRPVYLGQVGWQQFEIMALRNLPFASNFNARFTLRQDSFSLTQLQWRAAGSEIDAQASLSNFAEPAWKFKYRSQVRLEDAWNILRQKDAPGGHLEFAGEGNYSAKQMNFIGRSTADRLSMKYQWFHPGDISAHGSYRADNRTLICPIWKPWPSAVASSVT